MIGSSAIANPQLFGLGDKTANHAKRSPTGCQRLPRGKQAVVRLHKTMSWTPGD